MDNYTFGGQDNIGQSGTASHKLSNGKVFRNRGFFIEFKKRTQMNRDDLY